MFERDTDLDFVAPDPGLLEALGLDGEGTLSEAWEAVALEVREHRALEHRIGMRLYLLRRHYATSGEWEAAAREETGMPRRTVYTAWEAARVLVRFPGERATLLACGRAVVAELKDLTDDQVYAILERHRLPELSREVVRALVAKAMGREPRPARPRGLPPVEQLSLFEADELEPIREAEYAGAFIERLVRSTEAHLDILPDDQAEVLAVALDALLPRLQGLRDCLGATGRRDTETCHFLEESHERLSETTDGADAPVRARASGE